MSGINKEGKREKGEKGKRGRGENRGFLWLPVFSARLKAIQAQKLWHNEQDLNCQSSNRDQIRPKF